MNRKRWIRIFSMYLGIATLMFFASLGTASAATLCVNQGGTDGCYSTIQDAINAASDGDVINVEPGIYPGISVGKSVEIIGIAGPERTTINAIGDGVYVYLDRKVIIRGFRISATGTGVYVRKATLTLRNNEITSPNGAAIYCYSGTGEKTHCHIFNNTILNSGGDGIYADDNDYVNGNDSYITINNNVVLDSINLATFNTKLCSYNTITGAITNVSCANTQTADPLLIPGNYCAVQNGSPSIDAGNPSPVDNDPDNTRNNQGACGGPYAAAFWPYPSGGPVITNLTVTPASVPQGGTVTIQATGEVR